VDLVSHSGNSATGELHTLNVTDIHTGCLEETVQRALNDCRVLPFVLLGVDSDNGSGFINWHLKSMCVRSRYSSPRTALQEGPRRAHQTEELDACAQAAGWDRYDTDEAAGRSTISPLTSCGYG
jgi:hypothetical protein